MFVSRFSAKVNDDFSVEDRGVYIQEGNGCEGPIGPESNGGWMR